MTGSNIKERLHAVLIIPGRGQVKCGLALVVLQIYDGRVRQGVGEELQYRLVRIPIGGRSQCSRLRVCHHMQDGRIRRQEVDALALFTVGRLVRYLLGQRNEVARKCRPSQTTNRDHPYWACPYWPLVIWWHVNFGLFHQI